MLENIKEKLWDKYNLGERFPYESVYLVKMIKSPSGLCLALSNDEIIQIGEILDYFGFVMFDYV